MGRVFLGRSAGGRLLAVKVIRDDLVADPEFRARFGREVDAAKRVGGLFTALVVNADVDGPMPWLATAYVAGPSLADAVSEHGPLPPESVLSLAAGLAEGLGAIHAVGLVHRDLKPSNILLADDGPCVIDFGISRAMEATVLTRTGLVMGSPGFMSPEQAMGDEIGQASDVFSLGAVLVFAATGMVPFGTGPNHALIYRVVHDSPKLDNVPHQIRPIVERCLAKDPSQRPTPAELLAEVGDVDLAADWLPTRLLKGPAEDTQSHPTITDGSSRYIPTERAEIGSRTATMMTARVVHIQAGDSLCHQGCYNSAETEYRAALAQDSRLAHAHAALGIVLSEMDRDVEAESSAREAVRLNPMLAIAHASLGGALTGLKRYSEAEVPCRTAIRLNSSCVWGHNYLGVLLHRTERYPEAEVAYREAIRIDPAFAPAYSNLGNLLVKNKQYPEAAEAFREAIRLNPTNARRHINLGNALTWVDRFSEAETAYREAIRLDPENADAHFSLGVALKNMNRNSEAEAAYLKGAFEVNRDGVTAR